VNKLPEDTKTGLEPIAKRVDIERKIDLQFSNFEGMVTGVSSNLSTSGMFIQSNKPEDAGTEFAFALRIEEWSPIQGTARVIWIRPHSESPERPAGMGVQFVNLDAQSRRMIRWLVDKHLQEGGELFDLDTVPAGASKYGGRTAKRKHKSGRRTRRPRSSLALGNKWLLFLLSLAILAAIAVGTYLQWFADRPGLGRLKPPDSLAPAGSDSISGAQTTDQDTEQAQAEIDRVSGVTIDEVAGFIRSWADAWEARDAAGVLSHYSADFDAAASGGRQQWESDMRQLIDRSEHIRVAISALDVTFPTAIKARAAFFRSFRSNAKDESVRMLMELEPTDSGWKIRREQTLDESSQPATVPPVSR